MEPSTGFWLDDILITDHSQLPDETVGFIYSIEFEEGLYIGKKLIKSVRKLNATKAWKAANPRKRVRRELVSHPFAGYCGSLDGVEGLTVVRKEIICLCSSKKALTYAELRLMLLSGVLESDLYLNDNILGKFFRKDLDGLMDRPDDI